MIAKPLSGSASEYRHIHFPELDSTNTFLTDKAKAGEAGNLWVTSDIQTVGKGSRGRSWTSESGNLYASLLLLDPSSSEHLAELTFVASLAGRDAVLKTCAEITKTSVPDIRLKWPNDMIVNGSKCAGILLEGGQIKGHSYVVIGNGINCVTCPTDTMHPATTLQREGYSIDPKALFKNLTEAFASRILQWNRGLDFANTLADWMMHVHGLGEPVEVVIPGRDKLKGRFASIDDKGYMLLELADGSLQRISTADVFFMPDTNLGEPIV